VATVTYVGADSFAHQERFQPYDFADQGILDSSPTAYVVGPFIFIYGTGFTYGAFGRPTGGVISSILNAEVPKYDITDLNYPAARLADLLESREFELAREEVLAGADQFFGTDGMDIMRAYGGADSISAGAGNDIADGGLGADTVSGGPGNDSLTDAGGANYLRGDDGNDRITGGSDFDDINGNMGNDTATGGLGDDWVVGGKDNDSLTGEIGADIVYGNIGADTCDGGDGDDIVRGGQDNDLVLGGAGTDYVSGDRGDDTVTGGAGADSFHTFGEAGLDRVTDFNLGEGDRVQLDPGTQYTLSQVGADAVITMTGGGQMVLVGVSMHSLTGNWIFGA